MLLEKICKQLNKDFNQRIVYGLGLLLWTILMWDRLSNFKYDTSSLGVDYLTLYLIPCIILILQIIRNNQLLWGIIFAVITIFIAIGLYLGTADAIERSGNHVKAIDWGFNQILSLAVDIGIIAIIEWVIFYIRPKRLI